MSEDFGRKEAQEDRNGGLAERRWRLVIRPALVFLVYLAGFMALDVATAGLQGTLSVSLWFPPVGLTFALLLVFGWRYAPAVALVFCLHLILFRDGLSYPVATLFAICVCYAVVYAGATALLVRSVKIDPRLVRMRDVAWFVGVACFFVPFLGGVVVVSGMVLSGYVSRDAFWENLLGFWAGDATGIGVLTSFLLVALRPFASLWTHPPHEPTASTGFRLPSRRELPEAGLQVLALALSLAAVYGSAHGSSLDYDVYLAFAPLAWIALRNGFERTVVAVLLINVGVVVLVGGTVEDASPILLQFGLMVLTLVGLLLGGQTTERGRTEETIRESERRFRSVVQNSSEAVKIADPDGTLRYASPGFERLFGYEPEEVVGKNVHDYVHPEDLPHVVEEAEKALDEPGVSRNVAEYRFRHKDGTFRYVEATGTYLLEDPAVRGVVINARDITGRKEADERLRESEERYRALVEQSVEAIYVYDAETKRVLESNEAFQEMMGYSEQELRGMEIYDFIAHDREDVARRIRRSLEMGGRHIGERNYRRKDGSIIVVQTSSSVMPYHGRTAVCAVSRDVTELKEAQEKLEESERRFRSLTRNAPDIITIIDADNTILYDSPAIEQILGYEPGERVGTKGLDYIHPGDLEQASRTFDALVGEPLGTNLPMEYRVRHKDGSWRHIESSRTNLLGDPAVEGIVINSRDVTERKEAEEALRESEERFRSAFEDAPIGVALVSLPSSSPSSDRRYLRVNRALCEMLGYSEEELLSKTSTDITHPEDLGISKPHAEQVMEEGDAYNLEKRYIHADGHVVWAIRSVSLVRDAEGNPSHFVSQVQDVTERKRVEEDLKKSEERFRSAFENAPIGVALVGLDGRRLRVNQALCGMLGYSEEELLGEDYSEVIHPEDREASADLLRRTLEGELGSYILERRYVHGDGHTVWNLTSVSLVRDSEGEPNHLVCLHQDVTERKELEESLEHQAFHDSLTDLPNRALFLDRLEHALARARREDDPLAVLFVDLDDFKAINDSLGHDAGNDLLVGVAERLRESVRPGDTIGRIFGDEFAVLLESPAGTEEARRVAERICERLRAPFELAEQEEQVSVRASIGIVSGETEDRPEEVLRRADLAMYEAKSHSEAWYEVYDPSMNRRAVERLNLERDLQQAVEREEFEVHYQPIVELPTGEIRGFEALARWRHPERGLIDAAEFIQAAEEAGLIVPIGLWVLWEACRQAKEWQERDLNGSRFAVSVNLSAKQFQEQRLAKEVAEALRETGLEARDLMLEITENAAMDDARTTLGTLEKLKDLGVKIAVDDFGTGYSSLSYLKRFPVDYLKIDRSFVDGLGEEPEDTGIVSVILDLARILGLEVIAEGVETERQVAKLKELGCEVAQGYYFAKPLSGEAANRLLVEGAPW